MPKLSVPQSKGQGLAPRASPNNTSGAASGPGKPIKKKDKTPKTLQAGKKKEKTGGMWWQKEEVNVMLEVIKSIKPRGSYQWDQVEDVYNRNRPLKSIARDKESIR